MKRKGFTLVELLVVIAIIALLMGILMPALARVRQLAFRMTCGTNLSGIGKAMMIYANDYQDELPRAGGRQSTWGAVRDWTLARRDMAFGMGADGSGGAATISSSYYLLVKYADVTPKQFVCRSDAGTTEWRLANLQNLPRPGFELIDAWDFGPPADAYRSNSYSYHYPFGQYALTTSSEPGMAISADRNPWIESPAGDAQLWANFMPDVQNLGGTTERARAGNAISHQGEGQNVLFMDVSVSFENRPFCSVEQDNIYTRSSEQTRGHPRGLEPVLTQLQPANRRDSVLVHDPSAFTGGAQAPATRAR